MIPDLPILSLRAFLSSLAWLWIHSLRCPNCGPLLCDEAFNALYQRMHRSDP